MNTNVYQKKFKYIYLSWGDDSVTVDNEHGYQQLSPGFYLIRFKKMVKLAKIRILLSKLHCKNAC